MLLISTYMLSTFSIFFSFQIAISVLFHVKCQENNIIFHTLCVTCTCLCTFFGWILSYKCKRLWHKCFFILLIEHTNGVGDDLPKWRDIITNIFCVHCVLIFVVSSTNRKSYILHMFVALSSCLQGSQICLWIEYVTAKYIIILIYEKIWIKYTLSIDFFSPLYRAVSVFFMSWT